jgi:iron complex transport system ATP-binding protein
MPEPILQVDRLSYAIGATTILRDVSFDVATGEFFSIIGPNGAGKTTLIKCVNRILTGANGEIRILGQPLRDYTQSELAKCIAYVPQAGTQYFDFTVFEFVLMARYPHLSPFTAVSSENKEVVRHALKSTGTERFAERIHGTLSGGERQKVLIAAALAQEAPILLLDEPTTFLDPHHQSDVLAILRRINEERGATIVSVTHDVNTAALVSDRVLALKRGEVAFCGPPSDLMNNAVLGKVFEEEFLFVPHPVTAQPMAVPGVVQ